MNPSELEPNFRSDPEKDWGRRPPLSIVATSLLHHVDVASRSASRSYRCESLSPMAKPWFTAAIVLLLVCNKLWMAFFRAKRLELLNPLESVRDAQTHHSIMSDVEFPHLDRYGLEFGFSCTFGIQLISKVLHGTHCDFETNVNAAKRGDDRLLIMTESMMQHPDEPWKRVLCFTEVEFDPLDCSQHSEERLPLRVEWSSSTIHDSLDRKVLTRKADRSREARAGHRLERHMGHDWSFAQHLRSRCLQDLSL